MKFELDNGEITGGGWFGITFLGTRGGGIELLVGGGGGTVCFFYAKLEDLSNYLFVIVF